MLIRYELWTIVCALLPSVTAFYPYHYGDGSTTNSARGAVSPQDPSQTESDANSPRRSITLPLHRVSLSSRTNDYPIVNNNDPKQSNSVAVDQDGNDISYMVAVTLGSSKEEYHLLLDSAASNTWVMGEECSTDACKKHNTFGKGDSNTLKTPSTPFSITYGTGSVSGTTATDTLHISTLSVPLTFGLATNVSREFSTYPMDGILGLGRGASSSVTGSIQSPSLLDALASSKLIPKKLYGVHLSRATDATNDGEINFGTPNTDRYTGELEWLDTLPNDRGFWEVAIEDAGVEGGSSGLRGRTGIVDTGTSFMLIPQGDAVALHEGIEGYTQDGETFGVPCDTKKEMQITFGEKTYNISSKDWVGGTLEGGGCRSNIIGRQTFGEKQWLLGDVFLKNVYTVFEFEEGKVGFGTKDGESDEPMKPTTTGAPSRTASAGPSPTSSSGGSNTTNYSEASPDPQNAQEAGAIRTETLRSLLTISVAMGLFAVLA